MNPHELIIHFGYWAVLLGVGIESIGIPFPGETILVSAAIYAGATHSMQIEWIIAAAITGAIVGDNIGYLVGYHGGYRLLQAHGHRIRLHARRLMVARYLFLRYGWAVVFFGRWVAVLRTYAAFLAGTNRMPWGQFLVCNAGGGIVWATWWALAAFFFGTTLESVSRPAGIALAAAAAVVTVAGILFLRRHERRLEDVAERALAATQPTVP